MTRKSFVRARRIGDLGEDDFKRWCTEGGLLAVKSNPDRMGWDYFVEFAPEYNVAIPLDRQNDLKKVLVQVKATDKMQSSVRSKLSVLKRLVDADLPAFIACLDYGGDDTPQQALLLHIGRKEIEEILLAVRKSEHAGCVDLHKKFLALELSKAHEINLKKSNLHELFCRAVPADFASYVAEKALFRKQCGYDESSVRIRFSLAPGMTQERLADLMIGKVPSVSLNEAVISKTRFGIPLDKDTDRIVGGLLKVDVEPIQKAKLTAIDPVRNARAMLLVDVFIPSIPELPKHLRRVRLVNDHIEVMLQIEQETAQLKFDIDPAVRYPFAYLANLLKFSLILRRGTGALEIDLGERLVTRAEISLEGTQTQAWQRLHDLAEIISISLLRHRQDLNAEISLHMLEETLQKNTQLFESLTEPEIEFGFSSPERLPEESARSGVVIVPICISFESFVYHAIIKREAKLMESSGAETLRILCKQPVVVEDGITEIQSFSLSILNDRANELGRAEHTREVFTATVRLRESDTKPQD